MKNIPLNVAVCISIVALAYILGRCSNHNQSVDRVENEVAILSKNDIDSTTHSTNVSIIKTESKKEFNAVVSNNTKKALNKTSTRIKDVNSVTELSTQTNVVVGLETKSDTIIKHDTVFVTTSNSIDYNDDWCNVAIRGKYADIKIQDSITIIARRKRKKILWGLIKLPTKKVEVEAVNECPYTYINYAREIELLR